MIKKEIKIFYSEDWRDYELLDTGEGEKLERFGQYVFVRPHEDAVWLKCSTPSVEQMWKKADGKFWSSKVGAKAGWKMNNNRGESSIKKWEMEYRGIKFLATPTPFRHLGFFPEQASHWDFIEETIKDALNSRGRTSREPEVRPLEFLNLFGYTGVASLFALRAGAEVTHLDASKQTLNWAKENEKLNSDQFAQGQSLRVIEDDAIKFLEREAKRGNKYDAIIMDPPKFGRGPKGEIWKIEEMLPKLLVQMRKVLSDQPLFVILTSYAIDSSSLSLGYALEEAMKDFKGSVEAGELCVLEKSNNRLISLANTAVWSALPK
jgi:23S rRNA (cytosine1962-C5)-methyltransferase